PVHTACGLSGGVQAGHGGGCRVGLDPHPSHEVVAGGADLHGLGRDVDVRQLLELVVHRGQAPLDVVGVPAAGDVQEHAAVGAAAASLHLGVDGSGHLVAGQEVGGPAGLGPIRVPAVGLLLGVGRLGAVQVRDVVEHEATTLAVAQGAAVSPNALGDE